MKSLKECVEIASKLMPNFIFSHALDYDQEYVVFFVGKDGSRRLIPGVAVNKESGFPRIFNPLWEKKEFLAKLGKEKLFIE